MTTPNEKTVEAKYEELFANRGVIGDRTFKDYCTGLYKDILEWHKSQALEEKKALLNSLLEHIDFIHEGFAESIPVVRVSTIKTIAERHNITIS